MRARPRGFSTIELLIVVAIIGVLATIAIPNLLTAVQRGRQKRTMGDLRTLATAVEAYQADNNAYPDQPTLGPAVALKPILQPVFTQVLHLEDGWSRDFLYVSNSAVTEYTVISRGRDGVTSGPASGPTSNFEDDIIYSTGVFITYPEGPQQ